MRSRFQCRALCGQAAAHCCHIKAVIVTPLEKCYGAPPHMQHSVRPIAGTVRQDQWINGCIELCGGSCVWGGFIELQCRISRQREFVQPGVCVSVEVILLQEHCVNMLVRRNVRAVREKYTKNKWVSQFSTICCGNALGVVLLAF